MKGFRTEITPEKPNWFLSHSDQILMMGSCFSEHMGAKLKDSLFQIDCNPFGVLFNPVSIAAGIQRLITQEPYQKNDLFFHDGLWHSFDHHGRFSGTDPEAVLEKINQQLVTSANSLRNSTKLFLTFGTARVYQFLKTGRVVSNCHKLPAGAFQVQLLRVGDVVRLYTRILQELEMISPGMQVVFTVSPVRHWKDGALGNQVSKSTLILAVSELQQDIDQAHYFPAYELFMDDLRDYRFYDEDLVHPGSQGIAYTWQKFEDAFFDTDTLALNKKILSLLKAKNHRPRNPETKEYQLFISEHDKKINQIQAAFPLIDFSTLRFQP